MLKLPQIIGISGKIGSGKTTLSKYIQSSVILSGCEYLYERKSFAENVRQVTSILTGINIENLRSDTDKNRFIPKYQKSLGEILQNVGTGMRQTVHPDVWVNSLFSTFDKRVNSQSTPSYWIIDDVRFENEAQKIKEMGGILIRLNGDPANARQNSNRNLTHISETALDNYTGFDFIFDTNITLTKEISETIFLNYETSFAI